MERIKVFKQGEKQVVCFNLSDISSNTELINVVESAKEIMKNFEYNSVYTITDITQIPFDTKTKEIGAGWMEFNKPYVVNAAFIGATGVRKVMMKLVFTLSKRTNVKLWNDIEQALAWIDTL